MEPSQKRRKVDDSFQVEDFKSIIDRLLHPERNGARFSPCSLNDLPTPCYIVDLQRVKNNCELMRRRAREAGVTLRPHIKTHKTIEAALLQLFGDDLATINPADIPKLAKITVSTLGEARFFADHHFKDILYAVPMVKAKLPEAARLSAQTGGQFAILIDSLFAVRDLLSYLEEHKDPKFRVYIDVDSGYHRTGFDPEAGTTWEALELLVRAAQCGTLEIVGLYSHGGDSYHAHSSEEASQYSERETNVVVTLARRIEALFPGFIVGEISVGSTPTCSNPPPKLVGEGEGEAKRWGAGATEIHPGNYVFYDCTQASIGSCDWQQNASWVAARVLSSYATASSSNSNSNSNTSSSSPQRLLVDAGALALSKDLGATHTNTNTNIHSGQGTRYGRVEGLPGLHVARITQELAVIEVASSSPVPAVNEVLRIAPNHSCLAAACFPQFYIVTDSDTVLDTWHTAPRTW